MLAVVVADSAKRSPIPEWLSETSELSSDDGISHSSIPPTDVSPCLASARLRLYAVLRAAPYTPPRWIRSDSSVSLPPRSA